MNWNRIKCAVLGHKWEANDKRTVAGVVYAYVCERCGLDRISTPWHAGLPTPMRPTQPMPECKPPADWRERAEVHELFDAIERLGDRVEALESVKSRGAMAAADGQNINPPPTCMRPPPPPAPPAIRRIREDRINPERI